MFIFSNRTHLKNSPTYKILFVLLIVISSGCSTKKNTWMSRNYQATNTRFNVYFNGNVSYNEGLKNIQRIHKDDYSSILPMYPISRHSNATAATTNMNLTIEKCRKAIKLHSIKVKPAKNYKKANEPDYKLFYNQEEFNPALKEAWLLLGKAEFHKADFLGSVGTFSYIARHYGTDKDMQATCQLWIARAYGEMGWMYESEQVMSKILQDNLKRSNTGLFASVNADLLLKKHQYRDAIPFLELAISKESDTSLRQRFNFLLAQLYQVTKDNKSAYDTYSRVIKSNPPYEMEFNARISRAQLDIGEVSSIRKELLKMLKNRNNKEYKDQLYYTLGNTFLYHGDTLKAIENYKLSVEKSTRKGIEQAKTLITLGDLYYKKRIYVQAQPCYDEAGKIITNENEDYARVTRLAEMLGELVTQNDIVVLQDSLQRLSSMSESKRLEVVNKLIDKLNADERAAAEKELREKQEAKAIAEDNFANMTLIGGNKSTAGDWYFYNIDVVRNGELEFQKKWGKRKLEDNWRRTNKSVSLFTDENSSLSAVNDSTDTISNNKVITDKKKPEFYLNQIPVTPEQLAKSTAEIATALFSMGEIYKDKIEDVPMAVSTFEEFIRRFKFDSRVPDAYFYIYLMQTKAGNQNEANLYRSKLINEYPKSNYVKILSQPDYADKMGSLLNVQDSIYNITYKAYNENDFKTVYKQVAFVKQKYPLSTLMPKFLFLNALSIGKNGDSNLFRTALNDLVITYPQSDVCAMAKDILALIKQGQEVKTGTSSGSLIAKRVESTKQEINETTTAHQFSSDRLTKHRILLISTEKQTGMNKLLYNIASYNFSRFMIKNFDLAINKPDSAQTALSVTNFESYDEAVWYENLLVSDTLISKLMNDLHVQRVIISEENYALLKTGYNLKDYLAFQLHPPVIKQIPQIVENRTPKKQEPISVEKSNAVNIVSENAIKLDIIPKKQEKVAVNTTEGKISVKLSEKVTDKTTNKTGNKTIDKQVQTTIQDVSKKPETEPTKNIKQESKIKSLTETSVNSKQVERAKPETSASLKQESKVKPVTAASAISEPVEKVKPAASVGLKQEGKLKAVPTTAIQPKQEAITPLFKGLFGYKANEPHFIAIYILSGKIDFEKIKAAFDAYNSKNYGTMNLKVSLETFDKRQVILIGSLSNAQVAKSYLIKMVKEKSLFEGLKGSNYRNLLGSQKNLNVVIQQNVLNQYFEFMQEYYLK